MVVERGRHVRRIGDGIEMVWRDVATPTLPPQPEVSPEPRGSIFPRLAYMIGRGSQESSRPVNGVERQQIAEARRNKHKR